MTTTESGPRRIAFCITELEPGGAERCLVELVTRLDRSEFEPVVYCLGPRPLGNPRSLADELEKRGVAVHSLGAEGLWDFWRVLGQLRRHFAVQRPEIVQCFLFHANVLGALAARSAGVPHVLSGIRVAERDRPWHLRLARYAGGSVERHVCVSEAVRDFSTTVGRLPADKLCVIPNGIDVQKFSSVSPADLASLGVSPDRRVLLAIGRLERQKGFEWLIKLMPVCSSEPSTTTS